MTHRPVEYISKAVYRDAANYLVYPSRYLYHLLQPLRTAYLKELAGEHHKG